jgi:hypothetical protein
MASSYQVSTDLARQLQNSSPTHGITPQLEILIETLFKGKAVSVKRHVA